MTDVITAANYTAGEIIPRCAGTFDVFVRHERDVTIGGLPPSEWPGRVLGSFPAANGVICVRLALDAGDRLLVRMADLAEHVLLVDELAALYTLETDQVDVLSLVRKARALTTTARGRSSASQEANRGQ